MNLKKDYTNQTLQLNPDYEGEVIAVLTSSNFNKGNRKSVLYLHGYVDRLDVAPTGEVRIVDYKTGKSPKPGWEAKALFQLQV